MSKGDRRKREQDSLRKRNQAAEKKEKWKYRSKERDSKQ
jgi:hypothetical protein